MIFRLAGSHRAEKKREQPPLGGSRDRPPGDSSQQHGTATPDTDTRQPRQPRTPQPARRRRKGDNLEQCLVREQRSRAVKEKGGRDRDGGGSGRGSSPFPFPPCGVSVLRGTSQPSPLLPPPPGFLRPSFFLVAPQAPEGHGRPRARQPRERLRVEVTPRLPRRLRLPRLPHASTAPPSPWSRRARRSPSGGAAAAGRRPTPRAGKQPAVSAQPPAPAAAAPGGEEQQELTAAAAISQLETAPTQAAQRRPGAAKARHFTGAGPTAALD